MRELLIGVCDDEKIILNILSQNISDFMNNHNIRYKIYCFQSGEKLLNNPVKFDAIFLDIEMPGLDGIEVGKKIQKKYTECRIIMATSRVERFKETYKFNAFRFITKPFEIIEINEALEALVESMIGMEKVELYYDRNKYYVIQKDIIYFYAYGSYVEAIAYNKTFRKEISLKELEEELDSKIFFRVHKNIIINMYWINQYKNGCIIIDEKEVIVSRRRKKEFEKAYIEFDINYG